MTRSAGKRSAGASTNARLVGVARFRADYSKGFVLPEERCVHAGIDFALKNRATYLSWNGLVPDESLSLAHCASRKSFTDVGVLTGTVSFEKKCVCLRVTQSQRPVLGVWYQIDKPVHNRRKQFSQFSFCRELQWQFANQFQPKCPSVS